MIAPLAAAHRAMRGVRHTFAAGVLSSQLFSALFWRMVVVMLVPAIVVGVLVLLLHLVGVL